MNALETELLAERRQLVEEDLQAPVDRVRPVRAAAAELVVEDNGPTVRRQSLERREVMVRGAGAAVQAHERVEVRVQVAGDPEPRSAAAPFDPAFPLRHSAILSSGQRSATAEALGSFARTGDPTSLRLPAGTVTFVFTDVEGSTRLLEELSAEGYAAALAEHRRVLRAAFEARGGVEVDTQGDAFFFAFPTAPDAVEAAAAGQAALAEGPIRVRMGVHTGTPIVTDEGYVGADVHRAARIAAAGHGGQVLVSSSTASLVAGLELGDLGEHRFKDLAAAERVYQLGNREFPPLSSCIERTCRCRRRRSWGARTSWRAWRSC